VEIRAASKVRDNDKLNSVDLSSQAMQIIIKPLGELFNFWQPANGAKSSKGRESPMCHIIDMCT